LSLLLSFLELHAEESSHVVAELEVEL